MEKAFHISIGQPEKRTERQRGDDLKQRVDQHADHAQSGTAGEGLGHAKRNRKHDQADRIVQCDDGQQQIDHRALGLVLVDDHQRRGRRRCRRDRTKGDRNRNADLIRHDQMQDQQAHVDQHGRGKRLKNCDHGRLFADHTKLAQAEFIADGEGDKAQRDLAEGLEVLDLVQRAEAQPRSAEPAQHEGADQQSRDQITGHRRQFYKLHNS